MSNVLIIYNVIPRQEQILPFKSLKAVCKTLLLLPDWLPIL